MQTNLTRHAQKERTERLETIIDFCKGDFGKVVAESINEKGRKEITFDSGIVQVLGNNNIIITMYLINIKKFIAKYLEYNGGNNVPRPIYKKALKADKFIQELQKKGLGYKLQTLTTCSCCPNIKKLLTPKGC